MPKNQRYQSKHPISWVYSPHDKTLPNIAVTLEAKYTGEESIFREDVAKITYNVPWDDCRHGLCVFAAVLIPIIGCIMFATFRSEWVKMTDQLYEDHVDQLKKEADQEIDRRISMQAQQGVTQSSGDGVRVDATGGVHLSPEAFAALLRATGQHQKAPGEEGVVVNVDAENSVADERSSLLPK